MIRSPFLAATFFETLCMRNGLNSARIVSAKVTKDMKDKRGQETCPRARSDDERRQTTKEDAARRYYFTTNLLITFARSEAQAEKSKEAQVEAKELR